MREAEHTSDEVRHHVAQAPAFRALTRKVQIKLHEKVNAMTKMNESMRKEVKKCKPVPLLQFYSKFKVSVSRAGRPLEELDHSIITMLFT